MIVRGGMFTPLISWYPVLLKFVSRNYGRTFQASRVSVASHTGYTVCR